MKRIFLLIATIFIAYSCSDDVEFNTPAMQGNKDGVTWKSDYQAADIDFGGFLFEGGTGVETLQLITPTDGAGLFPLSASSAAVAIFQDADGTVYSTANEPHPDFTLYPLDPENNFIRVSEINNNTDPKLITGEFKFTAFSSDGFSAVNFIDGVFYRVPLVGGLVAIGDENQCLQASQALGTAQSNFNNTPADDPNYSEVCTAYRVALEEAIEACGDDSGELQQTIDGLGDCSGGSTAGRYISASIDGVPFFIQEDNIYGGSMSHSPLIDGGGACTDIAYGPNLYPVGDESQPSMGVWFYQFLTAAGLTCADENQNFDAIFQTGSYNYSSDEFQLGGGIQYYTGIVDGNTYVSFGTQDQSASFVITNVTPQDCPNPLLECVEIEGTFTCTLYNEQDATDTIEITNGEFRLGLSSYN